MRALKVITVDLWGTIISFQEVEAKVERRSMMIRECLREAGYEVDGERLLAAYRAAAKVFEESTTRDWRDHGPPGRWSIFCEQLGLARDTVPFSAVAAAYEDLTLEYIPPLMPGVSAALERLRSRYRLGLICNTGYTGGRTLREVLRHHGLHDFFEILVFSNEFGWMKPDPRIFHYTLGHLGVEPIAAAHVGDVEELDVDGALASGMLAARYLPGSVAPTRAHFSFHHWDQFGECLDLATNRRSSL